MKWNHTLLAITASTIWGVNFVATKLTLDHFPTYFLLFIRMFSVALILFPFLLKKPPLKIKDLILISFVLCVAHFGFMFLAMQTGLSVTNAVILDQTRVTFAVIMGMIIFKDTIGWRSCVGMILSVSGVMIIVGTPSGSEFIPALIMLIATFSWGIYNILLKKYSGLNILSLFAWLSLFGAPQLLIISFILEDINRIEILRTVNINILLLMGYTILFSTIVSHTMWYYLLQKYPMNRVVPFSLLTPIVGIFSGIIFLNEPITAKVLIGAIITISGVAIIVIRRPYAAKGSETKGFVKNN